MRTRVRRRRWLVAAAVLVCLLFFAGLGFAWSLLAGLPAAEELHRYAGASSSMVYDRSGRLLFEMPPPDTGRHSPVPLEDMPLALRQATVATEDASFYRNPGVDAWAILRAVWINLRGQEVLAGGSTITQQVARNVLLNPEERSERSLTRKLRESILAWRLARHYSKDEILELYLNEIYYGHLAYGVEAASRAYFGKTASDLDLAECALLAGLPQAPALYNPLENPQAARARQAVVLDLMLKQGYIGAEQARSAKEERLSYVSAEFPIRAPHFVMYVRSLLERELGLARLEEGGLRIYTTLDLDLNETARDLVRYRLERLAACDGRPGECPPGGHNVRNAAVVALDPASGEILAMVGSPDYFSVRIDGAVNGALSLRQPGSSVKPITYAAAFEQGTLTPATMMLDVRTSFVTREGMSYVPLNYDLHFRGPVRLREALASSYNLIAVKVLDTIGIDSMTGLARHLGITTFDDPDRIGLAVTLGGGEVRLLELAGAYAALADGGCARTPVAILRVLDERGEVLLSSPVVQPECGDAERALDERVAFLVADILSDPVARLPSFGEASALELSRPAAVKTGTTTDFRDNWTIGYSPELVVGVWVGNADNEPMRDVTGVSGAAPIWRGVMEAALKGRPVREFERPPGLTEVEVCALSGLLPGDDCPHRVKELFLEGTQPTDTCTLHRRIRVDRATGLPATASTPPERIVERVAAFLPPEAQAWAAEQGLTSPATDVLSAQVATPAGSLDRSIGLSSPDAGAVYRLDGAVPAESQQLEVAAWLAGGLPYPEVTLLVDGRPLARLSAPPYQALWQLEPGVHVFVAEAVGSDGLRLSSAAVRIEVRK